MDDWEVREDGVGLSATKRPQNSPMWALSTTRKTTKRDKR